MFKAKSGQCICALMVKQSYQHHIHTRVNANRHITSILPTNGTKCRDSGHFQQGKLTLYHHLDSPGANLHSRSLRTAGNLGYGHLSTPEQLGTSGDQESTRTKRHGYLSQRTAWGPLRNGELGETCNCRHRDILSSAAALGT